MNINKAFKALSLLLCLVLIAAIALTVSGCDKASKETENETVSLSDAEYTVLGSGGKTFELTVVGVDKTASHYKISTDCETLGEALLEVGLIEGSGEGARFYVTSVCGTTLDYSKDGKYWALYVGNSYATDGVMVTKAENGASYAFKAE